MLNRNKLLCVFASLCIGCFVLSGCESKIEPDFSGYKRVAELATLDCTFHNVAEVKNDGTDMLFGINVGYKKAWFEYDGSLSLGVDVSKVKITGPDSNNVVTISIPKAQVLGLPDADESSFSEIYEDTGLLTSITSADQSEAFKVAQDTMRETAESNDVLMGQARERAKSLLGQYVKNVGIELGQEYEIRFEEVD